MRNELFGYAVNKMLEDGVIELHTEGGVFDEAMRSIVKEGNTTSYADYKSGIVDTMLFKKAACDINTASCSGSYTDASAWEAKEVQALFIIKDKTKSFADIFKLYALAAAVELRTLGKNLDNVIKEDCKDFKEKAYSIDISELKNQSFKGILAFCKEEQMKIHTLKVVNYALSQLMSEHEICPVPSLTISKYTTINEAIEQIPTTVPINIINLFIIPQIKFYHLIAIIEARLAGYTFTDKMQQAANILISKTGLEEVQSFDEILNIVVEYIVKNLSTLDPCVVEFAPEVLFLPLPKKSIDEYYDNFKANIKTFNKSFARDSATKLLTRFQELLAHLIVHKFSEEEIATICLAFKDKNEINKLFDEVHKLLDLKEIPERAKIVCNSLFIDDRILGFLRYLDNKTDSLANMLDLIGILDIEKLTALHLSFITKRIPYDGKDFKSKYYDKHPKFFKAFAMHIDEFGRECENLIDAIIEIEPNLSGYLNWLAAQAKTDKLLKLLESQDYPADSIALIKPRNFKVFFKLLEKNSISIQNLHAAKKLPFIANFQPFVAKCLEYVKQSSDDTKMQCLILAYIMCTDLKLQADMEELLASSTDIVLIKGILSCNIQFFEKLKGKVVWDLFEELAHKDKELLLCILKKYSDHIFKNEILLDNIISEAIDSYYYSYSKLCLFMLYKLAEDKVAFWGKFPKSQLIELVKSFEKSLTRIEEYPELPIHFTKYFTAKELFELGAINFIHKIALSNPNYIKGELETVIQYYFLKNELDIICIDDNTLPNLVFHIHAQQNRSDVSQFVHSHSAEFKTLEYTAAAKAAENEAKLFEAYILRQKLLNEQKQQELESVNLEASKRETALQLLSQKKQAEEELRLQKELNNINIAYHKASQAENLKHLKLVNCKLSLEVLREKTSIAIYNDYEAARSSEKFYTDYNNLTNKQKVGLVLKITENSEIHNNPNMREYFGNTIETSVAIDAINQTPLGSATLCNLLAIGRKEIMEHAIRKFKVSAKTANNAFHTIHEAINGDHALEVLFYQGPRTPVSISMDCVAYGLIGLAFCGYSYYFNNVTPVMVAAGSLSVLAHSAMFKEKGALLFATTTLMIFYSESKILPASLCAISLCLHCSDLFQYAEYYTAAARG